MPQNTLINGNRMGFANVFIQLNGVDIAKGVMKSVNYKPEQTSGEVYGNAVVMTGKTQGTAKGSGDFEMLIVDSNDFMAQLTGNGVVPILSVDFTIQVQYSVNDVDTITDRMEGARIQDIETSGTQGSDAIVRKFTFLCTRLYLNNLAAFGDSI